MSSSGRDDADSKEEEEDTDAKIERLVTEIEELKASLIGVPEGSDEWFQIKTDIKDRDVERLLLIEKKRCDDVVEEYFKENPHVLEAAPECPVCLDKMWDATGFASTRFVCCGKLVCSKCVSQGGSAFKTCPLCRGGAPGSVAESVSVLQEKADSGIAWAQTDMGKKYLLGQHGVPQDVDKALSLFSEAAEKGSASAKQSLGGYYFEIANYGEARRWYESAAAEGEIFSLFQVAIMMQNGQAFDQNEQTRAEAFRLLTIVSTLLHGRFNHVTSLTAVKLSRSFLDSLPVMLHYLRPAVEEGNTVVGVMDTYAHGLLKVAVEYYGLDAVFTAGFSPVPEAMFWYRRSDKAQRPDADHPLAQLEGVIRTHCANCEISLESETKMCCVECKTAYYCNRDCQVAHWKAGHKKDCVRKLKKKLKAAGKL